MDTKPPQVQQRQPGLQSEMRPEPQVMPRFPGSGRLAGKTAIVTGGDSGIGQAVAVLFAREGANVADEVKLLDYEGAEFILVGAWENPRASTERS